MRLLSSLNGDHIPSGGGGGFELIESAQGVLVLLCLMVVSISIISMLVFACADDGEPRKKRSGYVGGTFTSGYGGGSGGVGGGCGSGGGGGCGGGGGGGCGGGSC
uniref:Glycine-rich protein n=1 Tax=Chenopodium quinoa TaxID=63459 RepID=A0A803L3G5_CHEQI